MILIIYESATNVPKNSFLTNISFTREQFLPNNSNVLTSPAIFSVVIEGSDKLELELSPAGHSKINQNYTIDHLFYEDLTLNVGKIGCVRKRIKRYTGNESLCKNKSLTSTRQSYTIRFLKFVML